MNPEQYELIIDGQTFIFTFTPDPVQPGRTKDTGIATLSYENTLVGSYPYNRLSFIQNPFEQFIKRQK